MRLRKRLSRRAVPVGTSLWNNIGVCTNSLEGADIPGWHFLLCLGSQGFISTQTSFSGALRAGIMCVCGWSGKERENLRETVGRKTILSSTARIRGVGRCVGLAQCGEGVREAGKIEPG